MDIIISVKPKYAQKIYRGEKNIELRRVNPSASLANKSGGSAVVYIYETAPVSVVTGFAFVKGVVSGTVRDLWIQGGSQTGITLQEYREYFKGKKKAYGVVLGIREKFERPVSISRPPQSFRRVAPEDGLKPYNIAE